MFDLNPWAPVAPKLDPHRFAGDAEAQRIAIIVAEEVEAEREAERTKELEQRPVKDEAAASPPRPLGQPLGLLGDPNDPPAPWCDSRPWFEFAAMPNVIERCAQRARITPCEMASAISAKLMPPNWMAFFWYAEYLKQVKETGTALTMAIQRHAAADAAAVRRAMTKQAQAAAAARHAPTRDARALVCEWWQRNGRGRMTKEDAADAIVEERLVGETRRTIRDWLKGI